MNREQLIEAARLAYVSQWEAENIRVGNTGNHNRSRAGITAAADVLLAAHQAELAAAWKEGALWAAVECSEIRDVDTAWVTDHENPYWPGTCSACDAEPYGHDAFTCDGPGHERQDKR